MNNEWATKVAIIRLAFALGTYKLTAHAAIRRLERSVFLPEIEQTVANCEIIEDYPGHPLGPACLVSGRTEQGRPMHLVVSYAPVVKVVTLYEPDLTEWEEDLKTRRQPDGN